MVCAVEFCAITENVVVVLLEQLEVGCTMHCTSSATNHRDKEVKERIAMGTPSHSYGTSLAIRDHTVLLPATRHK